MRHYPQRSAQAIARNYRPPQSPKPMDIPIISRQAMLINIARLMVRDELTKDEAIRAYAESINFTEESLREIVGYTETETAS